MKKIISFLEVEIKIGKGRVEAIFIFSNESIFCRISILFSFEEVIEILTDWQQAGFEPVEESQDFVFFLQPEEFVLHCYFENLEWFLQLCISKELPTEKLSRLKAIIKGNILEIIDFIPFNLFLNRLQR